MKRPAVGYPIANEEEGKRLRQQLIELYDLSVEDGELVLVDATRKLLIIRTDDIDKMNNMIETCGGAEPTRLFIISCHSGQFQAPFLGEFDVKKVSEVYLSISEKSTPLEIAEKILSVAEYDRNPFLVSQLIDLQIRFATSTHEKKLVLYAMAAIKVISDTDQARRPYKKRLGIEEKQSKRRVRSSLEEHVACLEKLLRANGRKPLKKTSRKYQEELAERVASLLQEADEEESEEDEPPKKKTRTSYKY